MSRGTVKAAVSGTGSVEPAGQLNLNFRTAGQISEVDVKVGDHVSAGQVLARLDPQTQQNSADAANAGLQAAQAALQAAQSPLTPAQVAQLQHSVTSARIAYSDTLNSVSLTNQQDANQVSADQNQYNQDQAAYNNNPKDQADLQKLQADQNQMAIYEAQYRADQNQYNQDRCYQTPQPQPACTIDQQKLQADQNNINAERPVVNQDQAQVNQDRAPLAADQQKLAADQAKQQADQVAGQARLDQAAAAITSAQDALATQVQAKPNLIASAQAQVASAQAQAGAAQLALGGTTLTAPVDGVVAALNGQAGEAIAGGASTTQQAPGSSAPQPPASSSGTSGAASTGGSAFLVLSSDSGVQAVVAFAESDAARVRPGAETSLTFDAIPNLTITGHVLAIGTNATVVSNVVDYYATVVLNRTDTRLKPGMTANAGVTVDRADNVLTVPNAAIRRSNGTSSVLVYSHGQQVSTEVEVGLTGDTLSEVKAGLQEGDQVVLPQLRTGTTAAGGQRTGGGIIPGAGRGG